MFRYNASYIKAKLKKSEKILTKDISFILNEGESLAIVGETGSGKTITALSIMGLIPENITYDVSMSLYLKDKGELVNEELFPLVGSSIVYIPQNGLESLSALRSVRKHLYDSLKRNGYKGSMLEERALELLKRVGFENPKAIIDLYPFELSGGMAQRITIALALAGDISLVIADEPTNGLDDKNREVFLSLLNSIEASKIVITHDISLASLMDKVIVLKDGIMMEAGESSSVLASPRCEYTKALINSLCINGLVETPKIRKENECCPFFDRCKRVSESCNSVKLVTKDNHSWRCSNG